MKRILKRYTSFKNYIDFLRRQPRHAQHIYAFIFAGSITAIIASIILYVDYGFWRERYSSKPMDTTVATSTVLVESPSEVLSRFIIEAREQFNAIRESGESFLEGKEVYTKDTE